MMFSLASAIANGFWQNSRADSLARALEFEVSSIQADAQLRRPPGCFIERNSIVPDWQREVWQEWKRTLTEVRLEVRGLGSSAIWAIRAERILLRERRT
jgi:hypothetical protein